MLSVFIRSSLLVFGYGSV